MFQFDNIHYWGIFPNFFPQSQKNCFPLVIFSANIRRFMMEFLGSLLKNIITVYTVIGCGVFLMCMVIVYVWRDDEYIKRQKPLSLLIFSLVTGMFWIFFIRKLIKST